MTFQPATGVDRAAWLRAALHGLIAQEPALGPPYQRFRRLRRNASASSSATRRTRGDTLMLRFAIEVGLRLGFQTSVTSAVHPE